MIESKSLKTLLSLSQPLTSITNELDIRIKHTMLEYTHNSFCAGMKLMYIFPPTPKQVKHHFFDWGWHVNNRNAFKIATKLGYIPLLMEEYKCE